MEIIKQAIRNGRLDDGIAQELLGKKFESEFWDYKKDIDLETAIGKGELV